MPLGFRFLEFRHESFALGPYKSKTYSSIVIIYH